MTYIDTQSDRSYTEEKSDEPLTDIYSTVSGNKYSFIGEGIYERKITKKSRLSAGLKYQQSHQEWQIQEGDCIHLQAKEGRKDQDRIHPELFYRYL